MRIDKWPMDRIMRLPDWCFGRRWPVYVEGYAAGDVLAYDISEVGLPERGVIWEFGCIASCNNARQDWFRLVLGHNLPATIAEVDLLEPLLMGFGIQGAAPRHMRFVTTADHMNIHLRQPRTFNGKKLILEISCMATIYMTVQAWVVVSDLPREVPDWLVSAQAINLP